MYENQHCPILYTHTICGALNKTTQLSLSSLTLPVKHYINYVCIENSFVHYSLTLQISFWENYRVELYVRYCWCWEKGVIEKEEIVWSIIDWIRSLSTLYKNKRKCTAGRQIILTQKGPKMREENVIFWSIYHLYGEVIFVCCSLKELEWSSLMPSHRMIHCIIFLLSTKVHTIQVSYINIQTVLQQQMNFGTFCPLFECAIWPLFFFGTRSTIATLCITTITIVNLYQVQLLRYAVMCILATVSYW